MADKWTQRSRSRELVGRLERVYVPSGWSADHDTNLVIRPDEDHEILLVNRHGRRNAAGTMECEVQVDRWWRGAFNRWVSSMIHSTVTATGVYVDDDGHPPARTELHPVDLIAGPVTSSMSSGDDWIAKAAAGWGVAVGVNLFAYRFAAASDTRKGLFFEGPPLWNVTRDASVLLPFPPRPGPEWFPVVSNRVENFHRAHHQIGIIGEGVNAKLRILVTCFARGHGGPGYMLGEAVAAWSHTIVE
jgi:hypothetical protein